MNADIVDLNKRRNILERFAALIAEKQVFVDQLQSVQWGIPSVGGQGGTADGTKSSDLTNLKEGKKP